jgi:hypothetical protein
LDRKGVISTDTLFILIQWDWFDSFLVEMTSQDVPDGGQFSAECAFVPFSEFSQRIQQVFQGWCILGWWTLATMVCNPATGRTEPRHTAFPGRINDQGLTAGVTFGAGWKVTFLG